MNHLHTTAIIGAVAGSLLFTSCNDDYLERFPETSLTEKVFFQNVNDLRTYTNGLYGNFGSSYWDGVCDNVLYKQESGTFQLLRGEINADNYGTWGWGSIRTVNFMLSRTSNVAGDPAEIAHYIGLARLVRAKLYYDKVKTYSDVPWYSSDLQTTDTEELYKKQDPRSLVVDSIMADLDFATRHMLEGRSRTVVFRQAALALQARIALHEGTFRKYHPELGLGDAERFLKIAVDATSQLMDMGYSLSTVSYEGLDPYESLFCCLDLTNNPEMIMCADYDLDLGRLHNSQEVFAYHGLSRSLVEDYLVIDGNDTRTFASIPGHETMTYTEIFANRDPRLRQTMQWPGFIRANQTSPTRPDLTVGGYPQIKFLPRTSDQIAWGKCYIDLPIFRYGETLLIYAEAKAEMGTLTQDDLDRSINLLRRRAGMPDARLDKWLSDIDPVQAARYSKASSDQLGAVYEVRRERRIELACEGFRYDDLMRWGCGKLLEPATEGAYIPNLGLHDITGDNQPDIAIVQSSADADAIPDEDKQRYKLTIFVLDGNSWNLTDGNHGYIYMVAQKDRFHFEEPKYYYRPISTNDISLNKNLVQNPYWE